MLDSTEKVCQELQKKESFKIADQIHFNDMRVCKIHTRSDFQAVIHLHYFGSRVFSFNSLGHPEIKLNIHSLGAFHIQHTIFTSKWHLKEEAISLFKSQKGLTATKDIRHKVICYYQLLVSIASIQSTASKVSKTAEDGGVKFGGKEETMH